MTGLRASASGGGEKDKATITIKEQSAHPILIDEKMLKCSEYNDSLIFKTHKIDRDLTLVLRGRVGFTRTALCFPVCEVKGLSRDHATPGTPGPRAPLPSPYYLARAT